MNLKHNLRQAPEYNSWFIMKQRCYNENVASYKYYGAKGIKVCDEWLNDFATFYKDMGPRPGKGWGVTRKDPENDFGPSNCEWAPPNKRRLPKYFLTHEGETLSLKDWAIKTGIHYQTLRLRFLDKLPSERILERK